MLSQHTPFPLGAAGKAGASTGQQLLAGLVAFVEQSVTCMQGLYAKDIRLK